MRRVLSVLPLLTCLAFLGCSNANEGSDSGGNATWTVAFTDAASDDLASFEIVIEALSLTRADAADVGVLDAPVSLDLVSLQDLSQVLGVASIPAGAYTGASVTVDFDQAEAWLVGETSAADILDGDGVARTGSVTLPIEFPTPVTASQSRRELLELDFDLNQSVIVDADENSVFLEPVVLAQVDPAEPKELVLVGSAESFDAADGSFALQIETFDRTELGEVTVNVNSATVYQVNGFAFEGLSGLQALASQAAGTWTQVYGSFNDGEFDADYVEAGTGTYNGGTDIVEGHVIERLGGAGANAQLMVLGHSNNADHSTFQFNTTFTVNTSFSTTNVTVRGLGTNGDTDDVNIGQRVRVFGDLSGTVMDASSTTSVLRLQPTRIFGFADDEPESGSLEIVLVRVGLRDESAFTWSDSGATPPDPDAFLVSVGSLADGLGIVEDSAVEIRGFFAAVDDSDDDLTASTVIDRTDTATLLFVSDRPDGHTVTATLDMDDEEVTLEVAGTAALGELALIDRGFVGIENLPDDPTPTVEAPPLFGLFFVRDRDTGAISLHLTFADFLDAWDEAEEGGAMLYNFTAIGPYDEATNTVTAVLANLVVD